MKSEELVDLNDVRMFVHVVRAGSFAEAARRLGVPPNTLSRRIRQLEGRVATRLLQRSTRRLMLTMAGQAFFERCAPAVDRVLEAGKCLVEGSDTPSGSVRVAAPADFLDLFSTEWVVEFLALYPQIQLDFLLSDARADLIDEGIDVAFRGGDSHGGGIPFRQITPQYFSFVASPAYVAVRGTPQSLQDLSRHDCLTVSNRHGSVTWTLHGPYGQEDVTVSGRFRANSARILVKGCLAGLGIALLPAMLCTSEIRHGRLVRVLSAYRREGADFNVLVPSRQQIPAAVAAFIEFATDKLKRLLSDPAATADEATPGSRLTDAALRV